MLGKPYCLQEDRLALNVTANPTMITFLFEASIWKSLLVLQTTKIFLTKEKILFDHRNKILLISLR